MSQRISAAAVVFSVAFATAACMGGHRIEQTLAPGFPDLRLVSAVEVRDEKGQVLVSGALATTSENSGEIVRAAKLTNPANDDWKGEVELELERNDEGVAVEDEILVKVEGLPDHTNCVLMFDTLEVTTFMTDGDGKAEIHLERDSLARTYN